MLSLKIVLTNGLTKTMRFTGNMSISEACKDIREKTEEGGADHSLFRPPNELKARKGMWMRADRTFNFYDVLSGEELHYRKRHRQMKVSLMNGQETLVLIDEAAPIREVCAEICAKLQLEKPYEEWSLTLGSTRAFLDPVLGLQEQGVSEKDKVWMKKKHFWTDDKIDKSNPMNLQLMYFQAKFGITHGEHFVTEEEAATFAAVSLQQQYGRFDPAKHKPAVVFKEIDDFFEEKYQKKKKIHTTALEEWKNLSAMTELDAMYQYMKMARGLATYGVVMFAVGVVPTGKREKVPELLGVAKTEVLRMDYKTRAIKERWPYRMIKRWAATNDMFTLDFGDLRETYYNCYTKNAIGIGGQVQGYLDIMLRLRQNAGGVTEVDDGQAATIEDIKTDLGRVEEYNTVTIFIGDSDGEDMEGGEVYGSDDEDPDPLKLPKPLIRPGNLGAGVGDDRVGEENDPNPNTLPKPLQRPGRNKVFVSDLPTCIDAVDQMQTMLEIPLNPSKVTAVDPDAPRKAFQEGVARLPRDLEDPVENAKTIAETLAGIIRAAREVAAKDNDISLLEAARRVARETEEILKCSRDLDDDPNPIPLQKRLLLHKSALKGAAAYAQGAVEGLLVDEASEQLLLSSANMLAESVNRMATAVNLAALIASGKQMATDDEEGLSLLTAAKNVAGAVEDLLATSREAERLKALAVKSLALAKVIPTKVQECACVSSSDATIAELATQSQKAAQRMLEACEAAQVPPEEMRKVERAAQAVNACSAQLVDASKATKSRATQDHEDLAESLRQIGENAEHILESNNSKEALEEHSNKLASNLAALIVAGKNLAKQDSETISLLRAAKEVSGAVEDLLATTRNTSDNPNVSNTREMLKAAQAVSSAVAEHLLKENTTLLPFAVARREAREVAAAAADLTAMAREVLPDVESSRRKELYLATQEAENAIHHMVKAVAIAEAKSADVATQEKLVRALKADTKVIQKMTGVARSCVPAIEKTNVKTELGQSVTKTANSVHDLVEALQSIPDEGAKAFVAVEKSLEKESVKLDSAMLNAAVGNLVQSVPRAEAVEQLQTALVHFQQGMDVMRKAETTSLVPTGRALVEAFAEVVDASISVASATSDAAEKQTVLQKARLMIPQVAELLSAAKSEVRGVAQEDDVSFVDAARNVNRVMRSLVGTELAEAIRAANRKFLPDISALLKAVRAASESNDEEANMSLLAAAKSVSGSLKELMSTMRADELPPNFVGDINALLKSVEVQVGAKGAREGDATATAALAATSAASDLLDLAQKFEEGPEDCDEAAQNVQSSLVDLKKAPARGNKATVDQILTRAEDLAIAADRCADVAARVPKIARTKPAELAQFVQELAPSMVKLVLACNRITDVHADPKQAAQAVACVREIAKSMWEVASASRTAKCDPQADYTMTTAVSDLRKNVRDLKALMEHATPGMELFEEASRVAGDAARAGVEMDTESPLVGLAGLEETSEALGVALKALLAAASGEPSTLGPVAQTTAEAAVAMVTATQNYDNMTRAVAIVKRSEDLAAKMRTTNSADEVTANAKSINNSVTTLVNIMKDVAKVETSPAVRDAIKNAYQAIKEAQPAFIETVKASRSKEGSNTATADMADKLVDAMRAMAFASPEAGKAEQLIDGGRAVASVTKHAVQSSVAVTKRPGDGFVQGQMIMASQDVDEARAHVLATARSMAPGRADLEDARKRVAKQVGEMETAGIAAEIGLLNVATAKTRTNAQDSLLVAAEEMKNCIALMLEAAKSKDMRELGLRADPVALSVNTTASTARELAGTTGDEAFQVSSLASAKLTGEAALHFLDAALAMSEDPSNKVAQKALLAANAETNANVEALKQALKTSAEALARCDEAAGYIGAEQKRLSQPAPPTEVELSYAAAQAAVISTARVLGKAVQKVQRGAKGNAPEIGSFCLDLSASIVPFVDAVLGASHSVGDEGLRQRLIEEAKKVCTTNVRLCQVARSIASDPNDKHLTDLSLAFKACTDALGSTVRGIRDAAVGEKECRDAIVAISKTQADLDSAVIFAETGHLQFGEGNTLVSISAEFEKTARATLAKAKQLVAATDKQAELGEAAKGLAASVEELAGRSKATASCIGDFVEFSVQKSLLLGTKSVAMRTQAVVVAARNAADEEQRASLLKLVSSELGALVKSVKEATSAAIETQSAIRQARDAIDAAIKGYSSLRGSRVEAKDVATALSAVVQVVNTVVSAASKNSAKELLASLNQSQEVVTQFLMQCKSAEKLTDKAAVQKSLGESGTALAGCIIDLLDAVNRRKKDNWEDAEAIAAFSDTITDRGAAVVAALKLLPGSKSLELAESTLATEVMDTLNMALKVIQQEAGKLQQSGAAKKSDVGVILSSAANALLTSMTGMLKASQHVQEELASRAKTNARLDVFRKDPKWAEGLMATIDEVVTASTFLVTCTNRCAIVDPQFLAASVEDLSTAAKKVSGSSSKLVATSKAKSDSHGGSQARLTSAGQAVNDATKALIEAAKKSAEALKQKSMMAEKEPYSFDSRLGKGELKAQLEIARLERELERSKQAAKAKADIADSVNVQERMNASSVIDKKLLMKKREGKSKEEDSSQRLRKEAAAAKAAAQKKSAGVKARQFEEDDDVPSLPPPALSDEEDDIAPPSPPKDSDDDDDDAAVAAAFLAKKKAAAAKAKK